LGNPTHARLVEVDPTHLGLADLRRKQKLLQSFVRDEALIDARSAFIKRSKMLFKRETISGKFSRDRPQSSCWVL
jgi:hypothetical protein